MKRSICNTSLLGRGRLFVFVASLLSVGSVLGMGQARAQGPDANATPIFGSVKLKTGFTPDPFTKKFVAGGSIRTTLGGVPAYVGKAPSFQLHYTAGRHPLRIEAESLGDATLLVNLPDGTWVANDDGGAGSNPQLIFTKPQSGRYDIWVGTFGPALRDSTLKISERRTVSAKSASASRVIVCTPTDWVQVNLNAGLDWFGRDVPGIRETPETKDSLTAMLKKHGFETQHRGVKGAGGSVKLQLFARLARESRTPNTAASERLDREVKAIADMVYGGPNAVGRKVYSFLPK